MSNETFPDNSDRSKQPETNYTKPTAAKPVEGNVVEEGDRPKVARITQGAAIQRKTPLGQKIKRFIIGDGRGIFEYIVQDVLVPAAKDAAADAVTQGIERRLFGEVRSVSRRSGHRPIGGGLASNSGPKVHYDRASKSPMSAPSSHAKRGGQRYDLGQIIIPTRAEANEILELMFSIVAQYEVVTVRELFEMAGIATEYTDQRYGWTNLRGAGLRRVREGYMLDFPPVEELD